MSKQIEVPSSIMEKRLSEATDQLPLTGPVVLNFDMIKPCLGEREFNQLTSAIDLDVVGRWTSNEGGNCLFATAQATCFLIAAGMVKSLSLVSGKFTVPGGDDIIHAWIEYSNPDGSFALNVSNLMIRPGYVVNAEFYRELNMCSVTYQSLPFSVVQKRAKLTGFNFAKHARHEGRVRRLTKSIFSPTRSAMQKLIKG